jgi:arsenate reductase
VSTPVEIWHNPRCSKSRATLELLQARGIEPTIRLYLQQIPTVEELTHVLGLLHLTPRQFARTDEAIWRERELADPAKTDAQILEALVTWPVLIQRPVVIMGDRAAIGRPPEAVIAILEPA